MPFVDSNHLIRRILLRLPPADQRAALDEVGLREKQGTQAGFTADERRALLFPLLRRVRISEEEFREIAQELELEVHGAKSSATAEIRVPVAGTYAAADMPLNELTAASLVLWQVSHRVAHVIDSLQIPTDVSPPMVSEIHPGSISFSLSGSSYLIGGIGLIIVAHTALPLGAAATIAYAGGSLSAVMGIVDSALNWYKTIKESSKIDSETRLNEVNIRKSELEVHKMLNDLQPASSLVRPELIVSEARRLGLQPAVAAQMINEALPGYAALTSNYPSPLEVTSSGGATHSATASA